MATKRHTRKRHRRGNLGSAGVVAWILFVGGSAAGAEATAVVEILPDIGRDIGGYTNVQRIFGLMWGGNLPRGAKPRAFTLIRDLDINAGRAIFNGWVGGQPETHAAWTDTPPRFATWEESLAWWDRWMAATDPAAFWMRRFHRPPRAASYFDGTAGADYAMIVAAHLELFDGRCARDPQAVGAHYAAMIAAIKAHDGPVDLRFFQPCNEPNNRDYTHQFLHDRHDPDGGYDMEAVVDAYTAMFNGAWPVVARAHPDVSLVGTCAGWMAPLYYDGPGNKGNQNNWLMWGKRFIDGLKYPASIAYYNYHAYSTPVSRHLAMIGLTQNYAEIRHGQRPRAIVTETNKFIPAVNATTRRDQFLFHLEDLFMMLERPDLFHWRNQFFAWGVEGGRKGHPDLAALAVSPDGATVTPTANYWPLWAMKNTRGRMLVCRNRSAAVKVFAAAPSTDRIVVSVYNPTTASRAVTIDAGWEDGIRSVTTRYAAYEKASANCRTGERSLPVERRVTVEAPPLSIQNVTFQVRGVVRPRTADRFRCWYGDRTELKLDCRRSLRIDIDAPGTPSAAVLRLAFERKKARGTGTVSLNGAPLTFDWDAARRSRVPRDWGPKEAGWIGIPVDPRRVTEANTVTLGPLAPADQRLLFAALELKYDAEAARKQAVERARLRARAAAAKRRRRAAAAQEKTAKEHRGSLADLLIIRDTTIGRYRIAAPLKAAVKQLQKLAGVRITADWKALAAAGAEMEEPVCLQGQNERLTAVLDMLLTQVTGRAEQLDWRVRDGAIHLVPVGAAQRNW